MTNTNCLEYLSCPHCGHTTVCTIVAQTQARVTDDGAETFGDREWDSKSPTACAVCGHRGRRGALHVHAQQPAARGDAPPTFHVHVYRVMRLFFPGITAATAEAAARIAAALPTDDAQDIDECDGETLAALVDVVGDATFEQSEMIDCAPVHTAAPDILAALHTVMAKADDLIAAIDSAADQCEPEVAALSEAVSHAEQCIPTPRSW